MQRQKKTERKDKGTRQIEIHRRKTGRETEERARGDTEKTMRDRDKKEKEERDRGKKRNTERRQKQ